MSIQISGAKLERLEYSEQPFPEEYGGAGAGITFDAVTTYEQALAGDFSWGFVIHTIVVQYVLAYGTAEQKQRWLPQLVSGERISALAMTEPGQGSDLQSVETHAVLEDGVFPGQRRQNLYHQWADGKPDLPGGKNTTRRGCARCFTTDD